MLDKSFLDRAVEIGAGVTQLQKPDGARPHFVHPQGFVVTPASDDLLLDPWRLRQTVRVFDGDSFIKYFTDYCTEASRIFVDVQEPAILGILDYHKDAKQAGGEEPLADWCQHRVHFGFRPTPEWRVWTANSGKGMAHMDFAEFLEDNLPDILGTSQGSMLEVAKKIEATKEVTFSSGVRTSNGEIQITYSEEVKGSIKQGTVEIPEVFTINIAPFDGCALVPIECRFRYRVKDKELELRYELVRPHKVKEAGVREIVEQIKGGVRVNAVLLASL